LSRRNLHATALLLGDRGVLIAGPSGSGKTTLALALIAHTQMAGCFARLVSDDQLLVEALAGRLVASCPATIAGAAEVYGIGPRRVPHAAAAIIDLVVRLVPAAEAPRFGEPLSETIAGVALPRLDLPQLNAAAGALAVAAWFSTAPVG
jgi:serine kinase of HPr protein (carbohydrate metabolism regulator)